MRIICVSGLKNSGKTVASEMLLYLLNAPKPFRTYWWYDKLKKWPFSNEWVISAFAKPLKQNLSILLNKPLSWFEDRYNKENVFVDLNTLKTYDVSQLGDGIKLSENKFSRLLKSEECELRNYCLSIRQLMQYYGTEVIRKYLGDKTWINATLNDNTHNLVISDLRFKTEYQEVKRRNGIVIYIERDGTEPGSHTSEREVIELKEDNKFDYIINNNGTLKDLFDNINNFVNDCIRNNS